jgi:hypothetical protein
MNLVIDTCIIISASKKPTTQSTKSCNILKSISQNNHKIVVSREMQEEYENIHALIGPSWYLMMKRSNRVLGNNIDLKDQKFRKGLKKAVKNSFHSSQWQTWWEKIEKDIRLFEAALYSDKTVISNEYRCRDAVRYIKPEKCSLDALDKLQLLYWIYANNTLEKEIIDFLHLGFEGYTIPEEWFLLIRNSS